VIGTTISHYRIVEKIGEGGMGEVYLAEDLKLRRSVALKFLPAELTRDEERRRRFVQEAQAAAAIGHPHLVAIYDIDEFQGRTFIAMEHVNGESLRPKIAGKKLDARSAVALVAQIAEALSRVHARGIVHRDLKPENVLITEDGYPKIIDFGLAKLRAPIVELPGKGADDVDTASHFRTEAGVVMGTVAYMSPEQARGEVVDGRSDIFSLGVLLFELLKGAPPFKRSSHVETLSAILKDPPPRLVLESRNLGPRIDAVLQKALAKAPADRYQTVDAFGEDLRNALLTGISPRWTRRPWLAVGVALALTLALGLWWQSRRNDTPVATASPVSVLIADFENRTNESVLDGALEQALGIGLEVAPLVTVYPRADARRVAKRLDPSAGGRLDKRLVQLVCRSEGVKVAIIGVLEPRGDGYWIETEAFDPVTSESIAKAETRVRSKDEILRAADRISSELRAKLGDATPLSVTALEGETFSTASLGAMAAYAHAQELYAVGDYETAIFKYRNAIAQDPDFGRAYSGLAVQLANLGREEEAERYFAQALSRFDKMTEREKHRTRGVYYLTTRNDEKAIEEFLELVEKYPSDSAGYTNLAFAYFLRRDMQQAMERGRRALEIYPRSLLNRNNVALYAIYAGDFETGEREAREVIAVNPSFVLAHVALGLAQTGAERLDEAEKTYRGLETLSAAGASYAAVGLADLALYQARVTDALAILDKGIAGDLANENPGAAARKLVMQAQAYVQIDRGDRARAAVDRALGLSQQTSIQMSAAMVHVQLGELDRARALASKLGARIQREPRAYAKLIEGEILLAKGDARAALDRLQESHFLADTWLGRFAQGRAYLALGAFAEAHSELERCSKRRGEAVAVFLDDVPSFYYFPPVHYYLGVAQEGLGSDTASGSFERYLSIREDGGQDPLLLDARRHVEAAPPRLPAGRAPERQDSSSLSRSDGLRSTSPIAP
jgi:tetratricopeptide (TPR) repeat protein/predicted Ser/Thr protein kinase